MAYEKPNPLLANRGQTPYIPTGYEGLQSSVRRKRQIGEALMQQGLAGPGNNVRSWAQVLGSLAQTWAGKSIQKDADKEEASIAEKIKAEVAQANQAFEADVQAGADPQTLVQKYGGNPWLKERLDPYEKALVTGLTNKQEFAAPVEMLGPDGKPTTVQVNKAGDIRPAAGGFGLPPVMTNVNGVAVALQRKPDGTILPQNLTDSVILGPDGKPMVNKEALDAKVKVAAAGAPNSQVTVHTGKQFAEEAVKMLSGTKEAAIGAIGTLTAAQRIRQALKTGKANTGPLSGPINWVQKITGTNKGGVEQRKIVDQALQTMVLQARKKLAGSGAISDMETRLLQAADGGDIDSLTDVEILAIVDASEQSARSMINQHNDQLDATRGLEGASSFIPSFELPEAYRRGYKPKAKAAPVARRGLPPKGATTSKLPPKPKSRSERAKEAGLF